MSKLLLLMHRGLVALAAVIMILGAATAPSALAQTPTFALNNPEVLNGQTGDQISLRIHLDNVAGLGVSSVNFKVTYDPKVLFLSKNLTSTTGASMPNANLAGINDNDLGVLLVTLANPIEETISEDGLLVTLGGYLLAAGDPDLRIEARSAPDFPLLPEPEADALFPEEAYSGDVTGDPAITFAIGSVSQVQGSEVSIPLTVSEITNRGLLGYVLQINYDPAYITFPNSVSAVDRTGAVIGDMFTSSVNVVADNESGTLRITGVKDPSSGVYFTGSGIFLTLKGTLTSNIGGPSPLEMPFAAGAGGSYLNSNLPYRMTVGSVTVLSSTPILTVDPEADTVGDEGGTVEVTIENTGTGSLAWEAESDQPWAVLSATSGSGNGTLTVTVPANPANEPRQAVITLHAEGATGSPKTVTITQEAGQPVLVVDPLERNVPAALSSTSFAVSNSGAGQLNYVVATPSETWVSINAGGSGTNSGNITFTVQQNTAPTPRSAEVTVTAAGATGSPATITIHQAAAVPTLAVTPLLREVGVAGGTLTFAISNSGDGTFTYEAVSNEPWATVTAGGSGTNAGTLEVTVAENASTSGRAATITISSGEATNSPVQVTIQQAGIVPVLSVNPTSQSVPLAGGSYEFDVANTGTGSFDYTAVSDQTWAVVTGGASGTDEGTIAVSVSANPTEAPRTAIITVTAPGAQGSPATITIQQAGPVLNPAPSVTSVSPATGVLGYGVNVTVNGAGFIQGVTTFGFGGGVVAGPATVNGAGTQATMALQVEVGASLGARTVTATNPSPGGGTGSLVDGFTINPPVLLQVSPTARTVSSGATVNTFDISFQGGTSAWTASSNQAWASVANPSGSGVGTLTVNVATNNQVEPRVATITITAPNANNGPVQVTISQAGAIPLLSVSSDTLRAGIAVDTLSFSISMTAGAPAWTVASNQPWATVVSAGSGNGNGTVRVRVAENAEVASREVLITVTAAGTLPTSLQVRVIQAGLSSLPPTAVDDEYSVVIGKPLEIVTPGVLANDIRPPGNAPIIAQIVEPLNTAFGEMQFFSNGSFNFLQTGMAAGVTTYQYRAVNPASGAVSAPATIRITIRPDTPSHGEQNPPNQVSVLTRGATLEWDPVPGADTYTIEYGTENFAAKLADVETDVTRITGLRQPQYTLPAHLPTETTFYWRVQAVANGITGGFSPVRRFQILTLPAKVALVSPVNNAAGVPVNPQFIWASATDASWYILEVSTNQQFTAPVVREDSIYTTAYTLPQALTGGPSYFWRVTAVGPGGAGEPSDTWRFTRGPATSLGEEADVPMEFEILPNYPNPFNPTTTIRFNLPMASPVGITVYDLQGRVLLDLPPASYNAGRHAVEIDASHFGSGMYLYKIRAGAFQGVGKMTLVK